MKTKYQKIKQAKLKLECQLYAMERDKKKRERELEKYVRRHRSLKYDGLETSDTNRLSKIYAYFDALYPIQWQGGLRCDNRGMRLFYWLDDDPDYLILHLTSTSDNICFRRAGLSSRRRWRTRWMCWRKSRRIYRRSSTAIHKSKGDRKMSDMEVTP